MRSRSFFHPWLQNQATRLRGSFGAFVLPLCWCEVLPGVESLGASRAVPEGCSLTWHGICLPVILMEDLLHAPLPGLVGWVLSSRSRVLSPVTICVLTTYGCNFIGRGVKGDSSPLGLDWWLHCLLIWGCQPTPRGWEWLVQGWCCLRSLWWWGFVMLEPTA